MAGYPFDSAKQARMRATFEEVGRQRNDAAADSANLDSFQERLSRVRTKMKDHLERHAPVWIGRETTKLIREHRGKLKPVLTPKWILQTEMSPAALTRRAIQNVELRSTNRMERLNDLATRMQLKLHGPSLKPSDDSVNKIKLRI